MSKNVAKQIKAPNDLMSKSEEDVHMGFVYVSQCGCV